MLLTLSAKSFGAAITAKRSKLSLTDLPRLAHDELGLLGLNVQTSLLKGWDINQIDRLRDRADKAACPCLMLIEESAHCLCSENGTVAGSLDRMDRVLKVAHRLGCSSVAMSLCADGKGHDSDRAAESVKRILGAAERLELNLLLTPGSGLTMSPNDLTGLIRKVGGFRVGAYPDFQTAASSDDPVAYLRSLAPYASTVSASFCEINANGKHDAFDLEMCLDAVQSVGFEGSLSLEYRGSGDPAGPMGTVRDAINARLEAQQK